MKRFLFTIGVLISILTTAFGQEPFDIKNVPAPMFRCPIYDGCTDPTIEWNEARKEWWVFYTQRRANIEQQSDVGACYGTKIGIAASKDNGRTWYYVGTANVPNPEIGTNTFWAPDVFKYKKNYYMLVTFIPGVYSNWGGDCRLLFYKSKDLYNWKLVEEIEGTHGSIDASAFQMKNGKWKMWYKSAGSHTYTGYSKNLKKWTLSNQCEINDVGHEGPVVFYWKGYYWNIIDECNLNYVGLHIYRSKDGEHWERNNTILNKPGKRKDDQDQDRHCDVVVVNDRAFIVYFTHPGRKYDKKGCEVFENTWQYRRASLQMAELKYKDGKITCNRDEYTH